MNKFINIPESDDKCEIEEPTELKMEKIPVLDLEGKDARKQERDEEYQK